jgi:hypothetical protein
MAKKKIKSRSKKKPCNYNSNDKKKKNRSCGLCKTVMDYFFPQDKKPK